MYQTCFSFKPSLNCFSKGGVCAYTESFLCITSLSYILAKHISTYIDIQSLSGIPTSPFALSSTLSIPPATINCVTNNHPDLRTLFLFSSLKPLFFVIQFMHHLSPLSLSILTLLVYTLAYSHHQLSALVCLITNTRSAPKWNRTFKTAYQISGTVYLQLQCCVWERVGPIVQLSASQSVIDLQVLEQFVHLVQLGDLSQVEQWRVWKSNRFQMV